MREGRVVRLLYPLLRVEKMCGRRRERKALVPGRQAHIIATLHSTADQAAAPVLSSGFVLGLGLVGWMGLGTYRLGLWSWR